MKKTNSAISRETRFEDLPELLRAQEVTAYLGLGPDTIYRALKRGDLPSRKIGGVIFIPKAALVEEVAIG